MKRIFSLFLFIGIVQFVNAQKVYFPPLNNTANWDTLSPASLGWCSQEIDVLYDYLKQQDTKGFIVLKNGKIVLEKYFGTFSKDSVWYWASAGKTITSFLVGKAQEEKFLSIDAPTSSCLGNGWTACTPEQENKITIRHQLTMTTGLNDAVKDNHCTLDTCLTYLAQPGTRWAYHNAPYTLLEKVLSSATKKPINTYTNEKLKQKTGITGAWIYNGYDNVFYSKARGMARFGLLMQNNGVWNVDTLLYDTVYLKQMIHSSQEHNLSYGYLWWLNGKNSFMAPTLQTVFKGAYAPAAPADMFAALGKNGQILSVSKSLGLVVVRMGNQLNSGEVPMQLCNKIWEKLQAAMCEKVEINELNLAKDNVFGYTNTSGSELILTLPSDEDNETEIYTTAGQPLLQTHNVSTIDISKLTDGLYFLVVKQGGQVYKQKFRKF